jgi:carboxymethylenebutenolidase
MTAENNAGNTALWQEDIVIARPGGSLPIFCTGPDDNETHPAIILVHEIFGLNDHIREVARRFAAQGYVVWAPHLFAYSSQLPPPADRNDLGLMKNVWAGIRDDQLINDLQAVFGQLRISRKVKPTAIGALGFCMGGATAYIFACRTPLLAWIVSFYGRVYYKDITECKPRHPLAYTGGLHCPYLGIFAGNDDLITGEHLDHLQKKLNDLGKRFQIKVYAGVKHAFFNDRREFYNQDAAADAWRVTLEFMKTQAARED